MRTIEKELYTFNELGNIRVADLAGGRPVLFNVLRQAAAILAIGALFDIFRQKGVAGQILVIK